MKADVIAMALLRAACGTKRAVQEQYIKAVCSNKSPISVMSIFDTAIVISPY